MLVEAGLSPIEIAPVAAAVGGFVVGRFVGFKKIEQEKEDARGAEVAALGRLLQLEADYELAVKALLEFQNLANIDELTGLPNKRAFNNAIERQWAAEYRHRSERPGGLMIVDIDHFKQINDSKGHDEGDRTLKEVASIIGGRLRVEDMVARIGGEEFAILAPRMDIAGMKAMAELVRTRVKKDSEQTVSIGLTTFNPHFQIPELMKQADDAVYYAKENGRDQVAIYLPSMPRKG